MCSSPSGPVERVVLAAAVAVDDLLDPAPAPVQRVAGQADDVERIHHRDASGSSSVVAVLKPVKPSIATTSTPSRQACGRSAQPGLERGLRPAFDHVEQPRWARAVTDRGEVDDHGDVLVAAPGVAPDVLIDAEDLHAVEPGRIVDQGSLALGQHGVVGGVPPDAETFGDAGDGEVLNHDALQRPPQPAARELRPRFGGAAGVLAPHMGAAGARVATDRHDQRRGSPPERLVSQAAGHGVAGDAFAAAASTPPFIGTSEASTTRQASTARLGSRRWPVTTRPSSSRRQKVVRSAVSNPASGRAATVASGMSRSSGWRRRNLHPRETSTPTRSTRTRRGPRRRRAGRRSSAAAL